VPEQCRAPLVLCYLAGRTRDEAARQLGWSAGAVKGRLERGRELLRQRLARRGLALSAALAPALAAGEAPASPVPTVLAVAALRLALSGPAALPPSVAALVRGLVRAPTARFKALLAVALGVAVARRWALAQPS